jgi:hypothetical protein
MLSRPSPSFRCSVMESRLSQSFLASLGLGCRWRRIRLRRRPGDHLGRPHQRTPRLPQQRDEPAKSCAIWREANGYQLHRNTPEAMLCFMAGCASGRRVLRIEGVVPFNDGVRASSGCGHRDNRQHPPVMAKFSEVEAAFPRSVLKPWITFSAIKKTSLTSTLRGAGVGG